MLSAMDRRTTRPRRNTTTLTTKQSPVPGYLTNVETIRTRCTTSGESKAYSAQTVSASIRMVADPPPRRASQSNAHMTLAHSAFEPLLGTTGQRATLVVAGGAHKPERLENLTAGTPSTSTLPPPPPESTSTSRTAIKPVDRSTRVATKVPARSCLTKCLPAHKSESHVLREDKWRKYRGIPAALEGHTGPTSTPRTTFRRTLLYTPPQFANAAQHTHRADFDRYRDAHTGLTKMDIVERGQKNQCTACGELPRGDGKPNHRWFDCPGLAPLEPRLVPSVSILPSQARNGQRKPPRARMSSNFFPQVLPLSAATLEDNGSQIPRWTPPIAALTIASNDGTNHGIAKRMWRSVSASGEENKLQAHTQRTHIKISNGSTMSRLCGLCGANGHQRSDCPKWLAVSLPVSSRRKIQMTLGSASSYEEPASPDALGLPDANQSANDLLLPELSTFTYVSRSEQTGSAIFQDQTFLRTEVETTGGMRLGGDASSIGEIQGPGLHDPLRLAVGVGPAPPLPTSSTHDHFQEETPLQPNDPNGYLTWFETHHQRTERTTQAGRAMAIENARKVITHEAFDLQKLKGMSRRDWRRLGVQTGVGALISRNVDEYLGQL